MLNAWLLLSTCLMVINWAAIWQRNRRLDILTKSLPILMLAIWLADTTQLSGSAFWFFIGLFTSAAGDLLILFPRFFIWGLAAFFAVHCSFLVGFNNLFPVASVSGYVVLMLFASVWVYLFSLIRAGIMRQPGQRKMIRPVAAYSLVLSLMAYSACSTFFQSYWPSTAAALVSSGALLFMFSDFLLAFNRFVQPLASALIWKRVTYQLGQFAIAAGVVLVFSESTGLIQG